MRKVFALALSALMLTASLALAPGRAAAQGPGLVSSILNKMDRNRRDLRSLRAAVTMQKYNSQIKTFDMYQGEAQYVPGRGRADRRGSHEAQHLAQRRIARVEQRPPPVADGPQRWHLYAQLQQSADERADGHAGDGTRREVGIAARGTAAEQVGDDGLQVAGRHPPGEHEPADD